MILLETTSTKLNEYQIKTQYSIPLISAIVESVRKLPLIFTRKNGVYLCGANYHNKIESIKELRSFYNLGLKDAKEFVEKVINENVPVLVATDGKCPKGHHLTFKLGRL